ncbi:MAG: hypothetical protein KBD44_00385 [Candidatus Pacebacteria bacterium]|nr:hypothetical protein [Candidatus Paceibacterota bacterium]
MSKIISFARSLLIIILMVAIATIAVPYDNALAGSSLSGTYTEGTGQRALQQQRISAVQGTLTAANTSATALATGNLFVKENLLDGIAWAVAKQMVSNMTRSLINWINSGFQGSPSFVTDFKQLLLDSLDQVAGEYIKSLGDLGEFICSPFQLDIQAALSINYEQARSGLPSGPNQNLCTLTGITSNIENFLSGTADSWGQWLEVTANPQNTPYGAYLAAEASLNVRLKNEAGEQIEVASWGDGFLSKKVCQAVEGTTREDCKITTPGQVVSEALTFQLSTGPRSLIEADEINELIGALLNQVVLQAVQGLNGLLGLSESGYGGGSGSYLDAAVAEGVNLIDYTPYKREMDEALAREISMLTLIDRAIAAASTTALNSVTAAELQVLSETANIVNRVSTNLAQLTVLINRYDGATTTATTRLASTTSQTTNANLNAEINRIRQEVILDYLALKSSGVLTTQAYIEQKRTEWQAIIYPHGEGKL